MELKECARRTCTNTFETNNPEHIYCSPACKKKVANKKQRYRKRLSVEKTCASRTCNDTFMPTFPTQVFCSPQCKKREKEKRRVRRRELDGTRENRREQRISTKAVEREGVPFGVEQILPGSFEGGKRR